MTPTPIDQIINRPVVFHNRQLTISGVCRTTCERPFPHFTIEDKTGTIICETTIEMPDIGAHIEVTGKFTVDLAPNCTFSVPRLNETRRAYIGHHEACGYVGCEFENTAVAA